MAKRTITATTSMATEPGTMRVTCTAGSNQFVLDEPVAQGGTDEGMNPVEAMLSALGACKCVVVKAYARAQGMDISAVAIDVAGVLDPDGYKELNPDAKVGLSEIHMTYRFTSTNTPDELDRFVAWVDAHCPVVDTIVTAPTFSRDIVLTQGG